MGFDFDFSVWLAMRDLKLLTLKGAQRMQLRKLTEEDGSKRIEMVIGR